MKGHIVNTYHFTYEVPAVEIDAETLDRLRRIIADMQWDGLRALLNPKPPAIQERPMSGCHKCRGALFCCVCNP